jgi:FAD/FMN-containing dehydrogenase
MKLPTDKQWREPAVGLAFVSHEEGTFGIPVEAAWALLRFFRTGVMFTTQEEIRQWAEWEYEAFLERSAMVPRPKRPRLVPVTEK